MLFITAFCYGISLMYLTRNLMMQEETMTQQNMVKNAFSSFI